MSHYTIVQPTKADASDLARMHEKSWNEAYPDEDHGVSAEWVSKRASSLASEEGVKKRREIIQESYDDPSQYLRIAKDESGNVVGFVHAHHWEGTYQLSGLYILSSAYGSGVAAELAYPALDWLGREHDMKVTVVAYNRRAIKFYEKLGFVLQPDTQVPYKDTPMEVVDMIRKGDK